MSLPDIPGLFARLGLLQSYQGHHRRKKTAVEQGCLTSSSRYEPEAQKVLDGIEAFAGGQAEGWACFAQELRVRISNRALPRNLGLLLSAEFACQPADSGDAVSLHVRHLGDTWLLTEITSTKAPKGFLVPHSFISSREAEGGSKGTLSLDYEVFWESNDLATPFRATLSRFTGFNES